jgi:hypothetical protein
MRIQSRTVGLLLAAAAAGLTAAAALPASAITSPAGYYQILVRAGTSAPVMCLQPADPAGGAGTAIVQQPCASIQAQNWAPLTISGTSYRFLNQASGLCMDVAGGAASGTPVDQWPCNSISNERWSWPHSFPDGLWPIRSRSTGATTPPRRRGPSPDLSPSRQGDDASGPPGPPGHKVTMPRSS